MRWTSAFGRAWDRWTRSHDPPMEALARYYDSWSSGDNVTGIGRAARVIGELAEPAPG